MVQDPVKANLMEEYRQNKPLRTYHRHKKVPKEDQEPKPSRYDPDRAKRPAQYTDEQI